jgi:hypothetical protein
VGVGEGPQAAAAMARSRIQVISRHLFIVFHLLVRQMRLMDRKRSAVSGWAE